MTMMCTRHFSQGFEAFQEVVQVGAQTADQGDDEEGASENAHGNRCDDRCTFFYLPGQRLTVGETAEGEKGAFWPHTNPEVGGEYEKFHGDGLYRGVPAVARALRELQEDCQQLY
jgi:hypothetical protein